MKIIIISIIIIAMLSVAHVISEILHLQIETHLNLLQNITQF